MWLMTPSHADTLTDRLGKLVTATFGALTQLGITTQVVSNGISFAALAVAYAAYRSASRAARVAERAHGEHGQLKSARIQLTWHDSHRGRVSSLRTPLPGAENTFAVLSAYSGPDALTIENVYLVASFVKGGIPFARRFSVRIALAEQYDQLQISGPRLPADIQPYQRLDWKLPHIVIAPYTRRPHPALPTGVCFMDPLDEISIILVAATSGHKGTRASPMKFGQKIGLVTLSYTYDTLAELLADDLVPLAFKHLLTHWAREPTTNS